MLMSRSSLLLPAADSGTQPPLPFLLAVLLLLLSPSFPAFSTTAPTPVPTSPSPLPFGLALQLESPDAIDHLMVSNVFLYVAPQASPSPFLPPGPFTATWSGFVSIDLRGTYRFRADASHPFTLLINGETILPPPPPASPSDWSPPVRLRKGTNSLIATLRRNSTEIGESRVRLEWQGRDLPPGPIPLVALTPDRPIPDTSLARHRGLDLFLTLRCGHCHVPEDASALPDFTLDAPSLHHLGSRRHPQALADIIRDPQKTRPHALMPRLLLGTPELQADQARDLSLWLISALPSPPVPSLPSDTTIPPARIEDPRDLSPSRLSHEAPQDLSPSRIQDLSPSRISPFRTPDSAPQPNATTPETPQPAVGRTLFDALRCASCHVPPGAPDAPERIPLHHLARTFPPHALVAYLLQPHAHFASNPMPDFHLEPEDAAHLAAWLLPDSDPPLIPPPEPENLTHGKHLLETLGCLLCHEGPGANQAQPPPFQHLSLWDQACLSTTPPEKPGVPRYALSPDERADLRAFLSQPGPALTHHVPTAFTRRWIDHLRCQACHTSSPDFPRLDLVGDKLRPEWSTRLLAGEIPYAPRPWLEARMPAFPAFAGPLAAGLAASHGWPPVSPPEPPADPSAAAIGRQLISASGGFSCVSCHAVGSQPATAVFDAPGVNLAYGAERLLPDFFVRWIRHPQSIEPTTKMPLYFDDQGRSPLADVLDGDGDRTINALWHYLRLIHQLPPPEP